MPYAPASRSPAIRRDSFRLRAASEASRFAVAVQALPVVAGLAPRARRRGRRDVAEGLWVDQREEQLSHRSPAPRRRSSSRTSAMSSARAVGPRPGAAPALASARMRASHGGARTQRRAEVQALGGAAAPRWPAPSRCGRPPRAGAGREVAPIETWSSWLALVGMVSTLDGWASVCSSLTRAAAVYWAIISPERSPGASVRKAGRPERWASTSRADPSLGDGGQLGHADLGVVDGQGQRLAVEVAAGDHLARREDERVVGGGVHLDRQHALQLVERVAHRAVHLRHAAQRVGVLDLVAALGVRGADLRIGQQRAQVGRHRDLARMRPCLDQRRVEGGGRAEHGLQAHGADDVRRDRQPPSRRPAPGQPARPSAACRSAARGPPWPRGSAAAAPRARGLPRPTTGPAWSTRPRPSPITTSARWASGARSPDRTDAAARRHHRMHLVVEHADQQLHHLGADAGEAHRQGVGAQQQHGPHHLGGEWLANAGRVRTHQVALQLGGLVGLDPDIGQVAEAGGDAVGGARPRQRAARSRPATLASARPRPGRAPR